MKITANTDTVREKTDRLAEPVTPMATEILTSRSLIGLRQLTDAHQRIEQQRTAAPETRGKT